MLLGANQILFITLRIRNGGAEANRKMAACNLQYKTRSEAWNNGIDARENNFCLRAGSRRGLNLNEERNWPRFDQQCAAEAPLKRPSTLSRGVLYLNSSETAAWFNFDPINTVSLNPHRWPRHCHRFHCSFRKNWKNPAPVFSLLKALPSADARCIEPRVAN